MAKKKKGNTKSKGVAKHPKKTLQKQTKAQRQEQAHEEALEDLFRPDNPNGY